MYRFAPIAIAISLMLRAVTSTSLVAADTVPRPRDCVGDSAITSSRAGPIAIGTPMDSVRAVCPVAADLEVNTGVGTGHHLLLVVAGDGQVRVWGHDERVSRLEVTSSAFRVAPSLGVGTLASQLLTLPDLKGGTGEGDDIFVLYTRSGDLCGLSFVLDPESALALSRAADFRSALEQLEPASRIVAVWISGPVGCERDAT